MTRDPLNRPLGAAIGTSAAVLLTRACAAPALAESHAMVIAHLLPEDLEGNEIAPAMAARDSRRWSGLPVSRR